MKWQHGSHRLFHLKHSNVMHNFKDMSGHIAHLTADIIPAITKRDGFSGTGQTETTSSGGSTTTKTDAPPSNNTLSIVLGVIIPISVAIILLLFLHRRHVKKQKYEDAHDKHGSLDFGLGEVHRGIKGRKNKKGMPEMTLTDADAEKGAMRQIRGLSMDMGSPYVPAGEIQGRGSFNSMSRDGEDPYRPVVMPRTASNSPSRPHTAKSSNAPSFYTCLHDDNSKVDLLRGAQTPSRSSPPSHDAANSTRSSSPTSLSSPPLPEHASSVSRKPLGLRNRASSASAGAPINATIQEEPPMPVPKQEPTAPQPTFNFSIPKNVDRQSIHAQTPSPPPQTSSSPPPDRPNRISSKAPRVPSIDAKMNEPLPEISHDDWATYADVLGIVQDDTSQPQTRSMLVPPTVQEPAPTNGQGGLMVPAQFPERRLSASTRPLPPDDVTDNPEQRANRIRSFYKEYFDDSKQGGDYGGGPDYYEDYGQEYLNEATIYDPQTGEFVVAGGPEFAQPVTRRAMTPPPRAPPQYRGGPRRPSMGSQGYGPPGRMRAYSSASGRPGMQARGRAPRRPMPPPAPLSTLPTPHMLSSGDSGAFSTIEFAPPPRIRDVQAGRPSSPRGEQRPYSPSVRAHTPLVSPFAELAPMPSPHSLRRSGTFTALDFAPPPRFKNSDAGSDNGSIRSGRSNMSAHHANNIRNGAYRVSRLPAGAVGTKDDLMASLRPKMDLGR